MRPHEAWLLKAENDLKSANKLMEGGDPILDTAIYHAQQCAEKALKAYLAYKQQPIQKTHDVELLAELCGDLDDSFTEIIDDAKRLSPYNTAFRYPDIVMEPDKEDVQEAIEKAARVLSFVKKLLS